VYGKPKRKEGMAGYAKSSRKGSFKIQGDPRNSKEGKKVRGRAAAPDGCRQHQKNKSGVMGMGERGGSEKKEGVPGGTEKEKNMVVFSRKKRGSNI